MSAKILTKILLESLIHSIRGEKVMFDNDLATLYGVTTTRLNEQMKRNRTRFPKDFCFQLTKEEWKTYQSLRSQNAILQKGRGKHRKYLPYVFTEHGAIMAANVLNSPRAVQMSVFVVRAFIQIRKVLMTNKELLEILHSLEDKLTKRLDIHESAIVRIWQRLMDLIDPPPLPEPIRRPIGFSKE